MSEIRVNNVIADNGLDAVNFTKGINATGIVTATSFSGNVTGNITGNVTGNITGNVTSDRIIPTGGVPSDSGTNPLYLGAGGVVQVLYAQTRSQQSTTSTTFTDATNLFVDITPKFSTSKILIQFHTVAQISGNRARFDIHKSTTNARLSAHPGGNNTDHGISAFEGNNINHSVNFSIMDIAGTTNNIRYKVQFNNTGGSTTYIQGGYSVGTLTVMELSA